VTLSGAVSVSEQEAALIAAVAIGPVAVEVNASPWEMYTGGIFTQSCPPVSAKSAGAFSALQ
jgi:hypothetical protein